MAVDLALLERAERLGESWLRLYSWYPFCLSFGRHEPAVGRYDLDRIRTQGLDTVRRPTGGRAVLHTHELTYAVACPCDHFGSLRAAYQEIHQLLSHALGTLGIAATLAPRSPAAALGAGACFSLPAGGEILVEGRKVIGSAQLRRGNALLQHGSILLADEQHRISELLRDAASVRPSEDRLADRSGRTLQAPEVAHAIAGAASLRWPDMRESLEETGAVLRAASQYFPRFRSAAWTWAR
jgi:lipoate-protein ligase A